MARNAILTRADCPSQQRLEQFGLGILAQDLIPIVSDHLSDCPQCCQRLARQNDSHDPLIVALCDTSQQMLIEEYALDDQRIPLGAVDPNVRFDTQRDSTTCIDRRADDALPCIANYEIKRLIGRGGMGAVYSAIHASLDRPVAIKVLSATRIDHASAIKRFRGEMKAVGRVNHPNIVQALDAGESDGILYLTMELISGLDLSNLLRRGGAIDSINACEIIRQAALGLHHVHEHGLTHRDIKPSNLMLALQVESRYPDNFDADSHVISSLHRPWVSQQKTLIKVADLGLSLHENPDSAAELTYTGQIMGTVEYMSPEQVRDARRVDRRADIYSLGATLYRLLCGQVPFAYLGREVTLQKLNAIAEGDFPRIETLHPGLASTVCALVNRMMENDFERRFQSMIEVADAAAAIGKDADLSTLLAQRWSLNPSPALQNRGSTINHRVDADTESRLKHTSADPLKNVVALPRFQMSHISSGLRAAFIMSGLLLVIGTLGFAFRDRRDKASQALRSNPNDNLSIVQSLVAERVTAASEQASSAAFDPHDHGVWQHLPSDAPIPAIAPFDAVQATDLQHQWADYLATEVTHTVSLPSGDSFEMRLLPPGQYQMGTSQAEADQVLNPPVDFKDYIAGLLEAETPKINAVVRQPFWLGCHEVTVALFRQFIEATGYQTDAERLGRSERWVDGKKEYPAGLAWNRSPGRTISDEDPVTTVSYDDATEFCQWLGQHVPGYVFQLPTEVQWEYACRAGNESTYTHGADTVIFAQYEWFRDNSQLQVHPVGLRKPNVFGIYDLQCNVVEWCRDTYLAGEARIAVHDSLSAASESALGDDTQKVIRSGYWGSSMQTCRPAVRQPRDRTASHHEIGFRLVCETSLPPTTAE